MSLHLANLLFFCFLRIVYIAILNFSHNFFPQNPRIASLYLNYEIKNLFFIQPQKWLSIQTHVTQRCSFTFKGVENRSCLTCTVAYHGDIKTWFASTWRWLNGIFSFYSFKSAFDVKLVHRALVWDVAREPCACASVFSY